jgi:hypothetical protein
MKHLDSISHCARQIRAYERVVVRRRLATPTVGYCCWLCAWRAKNGNLQNE